jgi:hypothetical protein
VNHVFAACCALAAKVTRLTEKLTKLNWPSLLFTTSRGLRRPTSKSGSRSTRRGSGVLNYNVLIAVHTEHHLIVADEVTNSGSYRAQLAAGGVF